MYIHRVIIKGVEGTPDRDLTFFDSWTNQPLHNVLLTGPNGSGKTTLLKAIAALWDDFSNVLDYPVWEQRLLPASLIQPLIQRVLNPTGLVAIEIYGLVDKPLWLFASEGPEYDTLIKRVISDTDGFGIGRKRYGDLIQIPEEIVKADWFKALSASLNRLRLGSVANDDSITNMLYIGTESRFIIQTKDREEGAYSEPFSCWLITYNATERWEGHIEGMLRNLNVRDITQFKEVVANINGFLRQNGKELTDFDVSSRLFVHVLNVDRAYPLANLSSGEQECLIQIFTVSRWLMEGGVVLIDEPDLHIHGSWQRSLIHSLHQIVAKKHGQLIVTSHSDILAEEYPESSRFHLEAEPLKQ